MEKIFIFTDYIQLDQLLKWENIIETGGQIKPLLLEKKIKVNNVICTEKRKKIYSGDTVEISGEHSFIILQREEEE